MHTHTHARPGRDLSLALFLEAEAVAHVYEKDGRAADGQSLEPVYQGVLFLVLVCVN